jgi:hypothetical protein
MESNNWIKNVIDSTNGITKVTPKDRVLLKIKQKIQENETIPTSWIWIAAASFLLLLSLNIKILIGNNEPKDSQSNETEISFVANNQLY